MSSADLDSPMISSARALYTNCLKVLVLSATAMILIYLKVII